MNPPKMPVDWRKHFPKAYEPDSTRADVFDPALRHHGRAFIKGPPHFEDPAEEARFRTTRARVLRRCLAAIGHAPVGDRLVVRGSAVLEVWYGERARPAKDLDVVVTPASVGPNSHEGEKLLRDLAQAITDVLRVEGTNLDPAAIPVDAIWTYERAEGRRLTFPWFWEGRVRDSVQVDVVFNEPLLTAPIALTVDAVPVRVASKEESLAWKLLWLADDGYPQGKDLYDAVLLAEDTSLPPGLLQRVFEAKSSDCWQDEFNQGEFHFHTRVDWPNFALEHPTLAQGDVDSYWARLKTALQRGASGT
ncbi:nucleotidyl transferase AbiEii/AbiGii toxin family protein [Comamonas sp. JC664]|uniref:nucleotidyl transferase AbiEii/AbiGii toxin family protein n=1 Tax=Comamonas sp. JC664 TaxID=2801917 RepID=UPI00174B66FB|nr:nucleotidyl transferase AbiEii/AbiGii toxin family protein [Comamonas sp. JC664]MBL0697974.1 nucleotidyl transferase AbiEii/AbiGii toxin family protein [Comamonas sp. JC664]GHG70618.1 hypothetical protein GCM10012319_15730 [Comamonas sp. KCTC 72670]